MTGNPGSSRGYESRPEWKAFQAVSGGRSPFSIGYGYVNFRGKKVRAQDVETFTQNRLPLFAVIGSVTAFMVAFVFLKTGFSVVDKILTSLVGLNAVIVTGNYLRSGGIRQLVMHMTDGRKVTAYVSVYTADAMIGLWEDAMKIMPDMVGRPLK